MKMRSKTTAVHYHCSHFLGIRFHYYTEYWAKNEIVERYLNRPNLFKQNANSVLFIPLCMDSWYVLN